MPRTSRNHSRAVLEEGTWKGDLKTKTIPVFNPFNLNPQSSHPFVQLFGTLSSIFAGSEVLDPVGGHLSSDEIHLPSTGLIPRYRDVS